MRTGSNKCDQGARGLLDVGGFDTPSYLGPPKLSHLYIVSALPVGKTATSCNNTNNNMAPKALLGSKASKVAGCWRSESLQTEDKQKGHTGGQHVATAYSQISIKIEDGGPNRLFLSFKSHSKKGKHEKHEKHTAAFIKIHHSFRWDALSARDETQTCFYCSEQGFALKGARLCVCVCVVVWLPRGSSRPPASSPTSPNRCTVSAGTATSFHGQHHVRDSVKLGPFLCTVLTCSNK
ncbi:hypothetical protein INR49_011786 [Caranx melampygus]|nr:hypothetical protein INR49_011786 [Caranx melampygus]